MNRNFHSIIKIHSICHERKMINWGMLSRILQMTFILYIISENVLQSLKGFVTFLFNESFLKTFFSPFIRSLFAFQMCQTFLPSHQPIFTQFSSNFNPIALFMCERQLIYRLIFNFISFKLSCRFHSLYFSHSLLSALLFFCVMWLCQMRSEWKIISYVLRRERKE